MVWVKISTPHCGLTSHKKLYLAQHGQIKLAIQQGSVWVWFSLRVSTKVHNFCFSLHPVGLPEEASQNFTDPSEWLEHNRNSVISQGINVKQFCTFFKQRYQCFISPWLSYPVIMSSEAAKSGDSPKIPPAMGHALKKLKSSIEIIITVVETKTSSNWILYWQGWKQ